VQSAKVRPFLRFTTGRGKNEEGKETGSWRETKRKRRRKKGQTGSFLLPRLIFPMREREGRGGSRKMGTNKREGGEKERESMVYPYLLSLSL